MINLAITIISLIIVGDSNADITHKAPDPPDPPRTLGLLYPFESESRDVRSLDGVWQFLKSNSTDPMQGVREQWYKNELSQVKPTIDMPVPASYNDVTTSAELRDHVGTVWYERTFFVSQSWALERRIWLRFGSVHYAAIVWLNGEKIMEHKIGHLPFEAEITKYVKYATTNRLTVLCDNSLLNSTIPQGKIEEQPSDDGKTLVQTYTFDFFNYAGIHRSVHLYTTPLTYIKDVEITTDLRGNTTGLIHYKVTVGGLEETMAAVTKEQNHVMHKLMHNPLIEPLMLHLQLRDKTGEVVAHDAAKKQLNGTIVVDDVKKWWPYLMDPEYGYLYTLELYLHASDFALLDVYRFKVGIRKLTWNNSSVLLNDKPIYMRGFGRHEDSDIRGKGLDMALLVRDFNLLKWIGANAYRTSHYPYSEESMQFADENGIIIIDECPSVNTDIFDSILLSNHKSAVEQMIHRDRNHASVLFWSLANEPRTANQQSGNYFGALVNYTKTLDNHRPITAVCNVEVTKDHMVQHLDVIFFNRYNGWYQHTGHLNMITNNLIDEITNWYAHYKKPFVLAEYGAETLEGLNFLPASIWSEDYQFELLSKYFKAFDILRAKKWFIGEFIWNFADFKTAQDITRVGATNRKGIFTRSRQPKAAAHFLRKRYHALAFELDSCDIPNDLFPYIVQSPKMTIDVEHTEL